MNTEASLLESPSETRIDSTQAYLSHISDELLGSLSPAQMLTPEKRRSIIARYSAVLEGNFIYWMTGALLAARSEETKSIIIENLFEEVRDSHPAMLRRFAVAANALPTDRDYREVAPELLEVRLFIGNLQPAPIVAMMAFFEAFIQRFMPYLEELAKQQDSVEVEYTQVHGVCDIAHSNGLFQALSAELALYPEGEPTMSAIYKGVHLLQALLRTILIGRTSSAVA